MHEFKGPGLYVITNVGSSTTFDLDPQDYAHRVHGWQKIEDNSNQQWRVKADPDFPNMWILRNITSGQYLNFWWDCRSGEDRVIGGTAQASWWLDVQPDKTVAICFPERRVADDKRRVADLHNGSANNGTPIRLLPWNKGPTQRWIFERIGE